MKNHNFDLPSIRTSAVGGTEVRDIDKRISDAFELHTKEGFADEQLKKLSELFRDITVILENVDRGYSLIFDIWTKIGGQPIHLKSQTLGFLPKILDDDLPRLQLNVDFPKYLTREFKTEMAKAENRGKQRCIQIIQEMLELGEEIYVGVRPILDNEKNKILKNVIEKLEQYET